MSGIRLVAFGPVVAGLLLDLSDSLSLKFDQPVVAGPQAELPPESFDEDRDQYLAGAFLSRLRKMTAGNGAKLLGITEVDIYSAGLNFVFGQADVGGSAAVISLARLYPDATDGGTGLFEARTLKEAVHELGHTFGLEHCRDRYCVMHFSNGIAQTDIKSPDFCSRHAAELKWAAA